jgi:hypothetical protein
VTSGRDAAGLAPEAQRQARRDAAIFRRRTVIWLTILCSASLAAGLLFIALSGGDAKSTDANAFSRSAIGHHALVSWLRASGVDVVVSRFRSAAKAGPRAALLIAEPTHLTQEKSTDDDKSPLVTDLGATVRDALGRGGSVIVVLPKWQGTTSTKKPGWIDTAELAERERAAEILSLATGGHCAVSDVISAGDAAPSSFKTRLPGAELPTLASAQLLRPGCTPLAPLVWSEAGILIARAEGKKLYIVADPDLLNTSGLTQGDNAIVTHRLLVDQVASESIIVDEVLHGFGRVPSLWNELFSLPLLPVTLHVIGLLGLVLWATIGRFGKPLAVPPRVPPGKRALVESTAELLVAGGHEAESLRHYFRMTIRHAITESALAPGLGEVEQIEQLAALARARGVSVDLLAVHRSVTALTWGGEVDWQSGPPSSRQGSEAPRPVARKHSASPRTAKTLALAGAIYRWSEEMKHGSRPAASITPR